MDVKYGGRQIYEAAEPPRAAFSPPLHFRHRKNESGRVVIAEGEAHFRAQPGADDEHAAKPGSDE